MKIWGFWIGGPLSEVVACKQRVVPHAGSAVFGSHMGTVLEAGQGRSQEETTTEANTWSIVRNQPYEIF